MNTKPQKRQLWVALIAVSGVLFLSLSTTWAQGVFDPNSGQVKATNPNPPKDPALADPDPIAEINAQIAEKQKKIDELRQQADTYKAQIDQTQGDITSLQAEVAVIDNQIVLTDIDIAAKEHQVESLDLEIRSLQLSIDQKSNDVNARRELLADTVRQIDVATRTTTLALVMKYNNFNEFYSQAQAQAEMSKSLEEAIDSIKASREELQQKQGELSAAKDSVEQMKKQLEDQRATNEEQKSYKADLLNKSKKSAQQYDQLLTGSLSEVDEVNAAIGSLQAALQSKLTGVGAKADDLPSPAGFIWPVPGRQINAYFLDPTYNLGGRRHYGIDIDADQGTPVKATADGVVTGIRPPDMSGAPSVVQIKHGGGFVSYYLHMHQIFVAEGQLVKQGDFIGYSGGQCGTSGAGTCRVFTTGAHMHYEMHLNNIAVDPLKYLP